MTFLQQIAKPLKDHTSSFFLSNVGNRCHISLQNFSKRWISKIEITDATAFQDKLKETQSPILAYFYKPQCRYCHLFEEKLSSAMEKFKTLDYMKVNIEHGKDLVEKYEVEAVPTLLGFSKGVNVNKIIGNVNETDIEKMLNNLK